MQTQIIPLLALDEGRVYDDTPGDGVSAPEWCDTTLGATYIVDMLQRDLMSPYWWMVLPVQYCPEEID